MESSCSGEPGVLVMVLMVVVVMVVLVVLVGREGVAADLRWFRSDL
jgi:hypothetical protein